MIQMQVLIGKHILQTATSTVGGEYNHRSMIDWGADKVDYILVTNLKISLRNTLYKREQNVCLPHALVLVPYESNVLYPHFFYESSSLRQYYHEIRLIIIFEYN